MIVRGIDPGPYSLGWCDLDHGAGGPWLIGMGEVDAAEWPRLLLGANALAVERAYGLRIGPRASIQQAKKITADLLATNWIACQIVEAARRAGLHAFDVDQAEARRGVGVQFQNAGDGADELRVDKQVDIILRGMVNGWPPGERATNTHERDAGIYSMHGAHLLTCEAREV